MRINYHLKNYVLIFRPSQFETFLLLNATDHTVIISYNGAKFWPSHKPWTISMYVGGLIGQYLITTFLWPVHSIGDVGAKTCTLNLVKRFASWLGIPYLTLLSRDLSMGHVPVVWFLSLFSVGPLMRRSPLGCVPKQEKKMAWIFTRWA